MNTPMFDAIVDRHVELALEHPDQKGSITGRVRGNYYGLTPAEQAELYQELRRARLSFPLTPMSIMHLQVVSADGLEQAFTIGALQAEAVKRLGQRRGQIIGAALDRRAKAQRSAE